MSEETPATLDVPEVEPFEFELPTGYRVRVAAMVVKQTPMMEDYLRGAGVLEICVVRVYCNQDHHLNRMVLMHEFHASSEFEPHVLPRVWEWLAGFVAQRLHLEFESLDDFIEALENELSRGTFEEEEAVEHIEHIPEICEPEAFDHEDDSIHNDQNEPSGPDTLGSRT
ncbi:MAG: hypothetical protein K1X78_17840 [Verrucomicrobiaceae bacterium]|nr:hypothetical protein [Verrucomicrobiaceae bacterium]